MGSMSTIANDSYVVAAACRSRPESDALIEDGRETHVWNDLSTLDDNAVSTVWDYCWVELRADGWEVPLFWKTLLRTWYATQFDGSTLDEFYGYVCGYTSSRADGCNSIPAMRAAHRMLQALVPMVVIYMIASSRTIIYSTPDDHDDVIPPVVLDVIGESGAVNMPYFRVSIAPVRVCCRRLW